MREWDKLNRELWEECESRYAFDVQDLEKAVLAIYEELYEAETPNVDRVDVAMDYLIEQTGGYGQRAHIMDQENALVVLQDVVV